MRQRVAINFYQKCKIRSRDCLLAGSLILTLASYDPLFADITATGEVSPTHAGEDPWSPTRLIIGGGASGTLDISNGGFVDAWLGITLGFASGSDGTLNITDPGSQVTTIRDLVVGYDGTGLLNVSNGGLATVSGTTWGGLRAGSGTINLNNGTLTTGGLNTGIDLLQGVGTINTGAMISDIDLLFDMNNDLQQQLLLNTLPGQYITLNLDASQSSSFSMGAGFTGNGSLTILDGKRVSSRRGYLGYKAGSNGAATISGAGSQWNITDNLIVGFSGTGTLNINNTGVVTVARETRLGSDGGEGSIQFNNGTLTTVGLVASENALGGTGTINTNYLVSDIHLTFDSGSGLQQQMMINSSPGQNITLNVDASDPAKNQSMGVGYQAAGTLTVTDGLQLGSTNGYLGYKTTGNGTATISGAGSRWDNTNSLYIGRDGTATLNVSSGAIVSNTDGYLGQNSGSTGTATINGSGSQWNANEELFVGYNGTGTLNILNSGVVSALSSYLGTSTGSSGMATVNGIDSKWTTIDEFYVGQNGDGILNIQNGGRVIIQDGGDSVDNDTYIGYAAGTFGTINVTGSGSELFLEDNRSDFYIGNAGSANLNIQGGGKVTSGWNTLIGEAASSTGTVTIDGLDSQWKYGRGIQVGVDGLGDVSVLNGATLENQNLGAGISNSYVGFNPGSTGTVTVDGAGSIWNQRNGLIIGRVGAGTLIIQNSGVVNVTDSSGSVSKVSYIASGEGSVGLVTVDGQGSEFNIGGRLLDIGGHGNGTLNITRGGVVNTLNGVPSFDYYPSARIGVSAGSIGTVAVDGAGSVWNNARDLFVGVYGDASLVISNGGVVNSWGVIKTDTGLPNRVLGNGTINLDNGTLNTGGLLAPNSSLLGTGIINTYSIVAEQDMLFDSPGDTQAQLLLNSLPGQNVTINFDNVQPSSAQNLSFIGAGYAGSASMTIESGAIIESRFGYLGYRLGSNGTANVKGFGSEWYVTSNLYVGVGGAGTLNVMDGGKVRGGGSILGYENGSLGTVTINGAGSTWQADGIVNIGYEGEGILFVQNGGVVNNTQSYTSIGSGSDGSPGGGPGRLVVEGEGSAFMTRGINLGTLSDGYLHVQDGGQVAVEDTLRISHRFRNIFGAASVDGFGSHLAAGYLRISDEDEGSLSIANGGKVTIEHDIFLFGQSSLEFGINSTGEPLIKVAENAWIDGNIIVAADPNVQLADNQQFMLIDIDGIRSGTFSNISEGGKLGTFDGIDLFLTYTGGDGNDIVAYALSAIIAGDLNGDGLVTNGDITPFVQALTERSGYDAAFPGIDADNVGDFNNDGLLTNGDIAGFVNALTGGGTAAPEPGSLAVLGLCGVLLMHRRRAVA